MFRVPERYRIHTGTYATTYHAGNNGAFLVRHPKIAHTFLLCIASDGGGFEHVSVTLQTSNVGGRHKSALATLNNRCPLWSEMCYIKDLFWTDDETVIQYHPARNDYVNMHPHCLHLWRPTEATIPLPPSIMVGLK